MLTSCHVVGKYQPILENEELKFTLEDRTRNRLVVTRKEAKMKNVNLELGYKSRRKMLLGGHSSERSK